MQKGEGSAGGVRGGAVMVGSHRWLRWGRWESGAWV